MTESPLIVQCPNDILIAAVFDEPPAAGSGVYSAMTEDALKGSDDEDEVE